VKKTAAFLLVLICAAAVFSQKPEAPTKEKIAVYVTGNVRANEKKALGTKILVELINSGRYRAVERSEDFVKELDREQSKQMSGAVDDNQITTIGKQFGVQVICVADLTPAFGSYVISARLIDVESAEIMAIADVSSSLESMDDLTAASKDVVRVILGKPKKLRIRSAKSSSNASSANKNSIGVRAAFGNAMNFDAQITSIAKLNANASSARHRMDLMAGYCRVSKSDHVEYVPEQSSWYITDTVKSLTKKTYSAFELVYAAGWSIGGKTDYNPISGYISFATAVYIGGGVSDAFDLGVGAQTGLEYSIDDIIFGIDFRPVYYFVSAIFTEIDGVGGGVPGFRFTIGLSVRYRI
jgi:hypothetical protein